MLFPSPDRPSRPPRVVITGAGVVTSLGVGWEANSEGFRSGRVAIHPVTLFDASHQRVKVAGEVNLPGSLPENHLPSRRLARLDRATRLLILAGVEAWQQAGWENLQSSPTPLVLGTTSGGMNLGQEYYRQATSTPHHQVGQARRVVEYQAQRQAIDLADALQFSGPINIIANACASGANAIGHAREIIRRGQAKRVFTGGYDALCHLVFSGFDSLQALSPTRSRPFDANRDGLALGEGAAMLALETLDSARNRNAHIIAEIVGYGAATDGHHLTQPHPNGDAALASMTMATKAAGLRSDQIDYINAHGTGTPLNDSAESAAINRWAGDHAEKLHVSSTKSSIGHLLGAAGAVETVVCAMALQGQWLPPTSTMETLDPVCRFMVPNKPAQSAIEYALTNSFGFGGANATLILRKWDESNSKQ